MQVDAGRLQIRMAEQNLDGRQIGAIFQQVSREAMPQHVRDNAFLYTRVACGFGTGIPDRVAGHGLPYSAMPGATGKQVGLRLLPAPVLAERLQQLGAQWQVAILATLAFTDVDDHPFAIDILHTKSDQFAATHAGRVERHQYGPRLEITGRVDEPRYFFRTQHLRDAVMRVPGVRNRIRRESPLQGATKKNRRPAT